MIRHASRQPVERFFEYSLLGLLASGFLSLATARALDGFTLAVTLIAIAARAATVAGRFRLSFPPAYLSTAALLCAAAYPIDYYYVSNDFWRATLHCFCLIAAVKVASARSRRDHLYIAAVALLELGGAAFLSVQPVFFLWLTLFVVFAAAAFASADITRGLRLAQQTAPLPVRASLGWRLSALALSAAAGILLIAAALFLAVPRGARAAARFFPGVRRISGFTSEVDLGNFGAITQDTRPVMHVTSYRGRLPDGLKWRGTALSVFDGKRWSEPLSGGARIPLPGGAAQVADQLQRSRRDGARLLYRVDETSSDSGFLFIAGIPEFINIATPRLIRTSEDSFHIAHGSGEPLSYEVSAHSGLPLPTSPAPADRSRYLQLPAIDTRIWALAQRWAGAGDAATRATRIERRLREDYVYTLDAARAPAKDPLARFLFDTRRGYCEYFASAMAVMLRTLGIPSRVATGFQSGFYNDVSERYVIRASDAHAWVEGWIDGRGWVTFDPTPPAPPQSAGMMARLNVYLDAMDSVWQQWVVSYDLSQQLELAAKLQRSLRGWRRSAGVNTKWRGAGAAVAWTLGFAGLLWGGFTAIPRLRRRWQSATAVHRLRRGSPSAHDVTILYERLLRSLASRGYRKPPWFTPEEFARSLPEPERYGAMAFTQLYNAARFGGDTAAAAEMIGFSFRARDEAESQ